MKLLSDDEVLLRNTVQDFILNERLIDLEESIIKNSDILNLDIFGEQEGILHFAVVNGSDTILDLLLQNGISINTTGKDNETPLLRAVQSSTLTRVKFLLDRGAFVDGHATSVSTPLLLSIAKGNMELFNLFLDNNANINRFNLRIKQTPLDLAINFFKDEMAEILIARGGKTFAQL